MFRENLRMMQDAKNGKRILHPVIYFILGWVFFLLYNVFYAIAMIISEAALGPKAEDPFISACVMLYSFAFEAVLVFLCVRLVEGRKISSIGFYKQGWIKKLFMGVAFGIILISAAMGIFALMGFVSVDPPSSQLTGFASLGHVLVLFTAFIVQGGTEEVLSRGWILNCVSARYNKVVGVVVSTIYFMSCHIFNAGFNVLVVVTIILFSILQCLLVFRTNSIWAAIGFHGAWNFAIGNIYGLDVSGNKIGGGSLMDLSVNGSTILAGGTFGIEGSVIIFLVLVLGIAGIVLSERRAQNKRTA